VAQNAPDPSGPAGSEFGILRQMIEQQSKQIDVLAQEIAHLNLLLEAKTPAASGPAPGAPETATAPAHAPAHAEPGSAAPAGPAVETAPAAPAGAVHVVAKGETLTAIARRYRVTVPDLLKVNKITDVRKLQIGQTLVLPPGAKIPESSPPAPQP
jgi:LysM repeat protein